MVGGKDAAGSVLTRVGARASERRNDRTIPIKTFLDSRNKKIVMF
jgi:hypothetical protein